MNDRQTYRQHYSGYSTDPHQDAHYHLSSAVFGNGRSGLLADVDDLKTWRRRIEKIIDIAKWGALAGVVILATVSKEQAAGLIVTVLRGLL